MVGPPGGGARTVGDLGVPWATNLFLLEGARRWSIVRSWQTDRSVLLDTVLGSGRRGLVGLGDAGQLAAVLAGVLVEPAAPEQASVTRGVWDRLPADVLASARYRPALLWDWLACDRPPPTQAGEEHVRPLITQDEREEVLAFLATAYPAGWKVPRDQAEQRWWGWRDDAGALLGTAGARALTPGGPARLGGIATHPTARRRGIASALTAVATRESLAAAPWVSLAIRADNAAARSVYTRLGFVIHAELETLRREPATPGSPPRRSA